MLVNNLKFLISHSAIYGIGMVISQFVGFVMLPVYTRYLTPSDYGILEIITITNSVLGTLISFGVAFAIIRFYYEHDDAQYRNSVIATSAVLYASCALLAGIILFNFLGIISYLTIGSKEYAEYFKISLGFLLIGGFNNIGDTYLRVNKRPGLYVFLTTSRLISLLSLNIYFVVVAKAGVMGILYSSLLTSVFFAAIIMIPILWQVGLRFSGRLARDMLKFSLPLVPTNILQIVINQSDRFFIRILLSVADTGIFGLAVRMGTVILTLVTYPFNLAFLQRRFEIIKMDDACITFTKVFTYFSLLIFFLGLGLSLFSREIFVIMTTPKFYRAASLVPFVVLYSIVFSVRYHFNFGILWSKKTYYLIYISVVIAMINLFSNYFLIKTLGLFGAVYAKCLTATVHTILIYAVGNRLYKIEYEFKRVIKAFALALFIYILSIFINSGHLLADICVKLFLVASYPAILCVSRVITPEETKKMRHVLGQYRPAFLCAGK